MPGRLAASQSAAAAAVTGPIKVGASLLAAALILGGCASWPTGPTVPVLPGGGKSLEEFRTDDAACQQYALVQIGGAIPDQAATSSALRSAAAGTAAGPVAGAAMGGSSRQSAYDMQRRYDHGYIQCMYVKGHRVPVLGPMTSRHAFESSAPPPPPPGTVPPAAPRY